MFYIIGVEENEDPIEPHISNQALGVVHELCLQILPIFNHLNWINGIRLTWGRQGQ